MQSSLIFKERKSTSIAKSSCCPQRGQLLTASLKAWRRSRSGRGTMLNLKISIVRIYRWNACQLEAYWKEFTENLTKVSCGRLN